MGQFMVLGGQLAAGVFANRTYITGSGKRSLKLNQSPFRVSASSITNALAASSPRRNEGQRGRDPSPWMAQVIAKKESAHPGKLLIFTRGSAHTGTPFFPWPLEG